MQINATFIHTIITEEAMRMAHNPLIMTVFVNILAYKYKPAKCSQTYLESIRTEFEFIYGPDYTIDLFDLDEQTYLEDLLDVQAFHLLIDLKDSPMLSKELH